MVAGTHYIKENIRMKGAIRLFRTSKKLGASGSYEQDFRELQCSYTVLRMSATNICRFELLA